MSENTKLSSSVTVRQYKLMEAADDRAGIRDFLIERFDERYFRPIEDSKSKHGFAAMAIACLVIETLESFYQGLPDTTHKSKELFREFLNRKTKLNVLAGNNDWFYKDIRCGILHQSESRQGWRVLRSGPLADIPNKTINATRVIRALRDEVELYARRITEDDKLWKKLGNKMAAVCQNCQ